MKLRKLEFSSFPTFVLFILMVMLGVPTTAQNKNKKHSVREMREAQASNVVRPQEKAMIHPLFLMNKKPNISIPSNALGGIGGGSIAREQVTYTNPNNYTGLFEQNEDGTKTYGLQEVVVEARSVFTPERDGKISVDFLVKVPKELIDKNWMIRMQPFIIHKDSLQKLDRVVVKGDQFALKQKLDHQAYQDYLNSIVPRSDYDKVFLDHEGIERDIKERQQFYYEQYHQNWALHKEYEEWLAQEEEKKAAKKAVIIGELAEKRNEYRRKLLEHAMKDVARGVDTTGLGAVYNYEYLRRSAGLYKKLEKLENEELNVPKRYEEVHAMQTGAKDVENFTMSSQDTINIAKSRYMFDAIMENEAKDARKEIVKKEMIRFPYEKNARVDTMLVGGSDFVYYFKQDIPLKPGMSSVKIGMESQVIALDESKYTMRRADTLSYFISSIAQLADTTLLHKETIKKRNLSHRQTAYFQYRPNTWRFDAKYKNNNAELEKLAADYKTFQSSAGYVVDSIFIQQSTSLDGEYNKNADLSMKRIEDVKKYLVASTEMGKELGGSNITTNYIGEDWNGLVRMLRASQDVKNKDAILDILGNAVDADKAKQEIATKFPDDFKLMKDSIYPKLDRVDVLFYVHRKGMDQDTEVITATPEYVEGVRLLQQREYDKALKLLSNTQDYNFAVCLAALGYNGQAYEVLSKEKVTNGNIEYLSAILAWRIGQEDLAVEHLMKAIQLDDTKIYRIELDSDAKAIVEKKNLQDRISQLMN